MAGVEEAQGLLKPAGKDTEHYPNLARLDMVD